MTRLAFDAFDALDALGLRSLRRLGGFSGVESIISFRGGDAGDGVVRLVREIYSVAALPPPEDVGYHERGGDEGLENGGERQGGGAHRADHDVHLARARQLVWLVDAYRWHRIYCNICGYISARR